MGKLLDLFLTFMQIGVFTFGGGYAMIPLIEDRCVTRKGWITHQEMLDITVIAESTPGPIAINAATFVGYRRAGVPGAAVASLGVVLPSFVIICIIAALFDDFLAIPAVAGAFRGIKAAVGLLILSAGLRMVRKMPRKPLPLTLLGVTLAALTAALLLSRRLSTILLMVVASGVGVIACALQQGKEAGKK